MKQAALVAFLLMVSTVAMAQQAPGSDGTVNPFLRKQHNQIFASAAIGRGVDFGDPTTNGRLQVETGDNRYWFYDFASFTELFDYTNRLGWACTVLVPIGDRRGSFNNTFYNLVFTFVGSTAKESR